MFFLHVVASAVGDELEDLAELQRGGAVVNLGDGLSIHDYFPNPCTQGCVAILTTKRPVTLTIMLAIEGDEGCASRVVILCCTFSNGRD